MSQEAHDGSSVAKGELSYITGEGYDRLGRFMGDLPEFANFRRFLALSAEDLLYRQAELIELETSLREYQAADKESGHEDRTRYAFNWDKIQQSGSEDAEEGNDSSQYDTIMEIREKLEKYHEALLRHRRVLELRTPLRGQVKALDDWMKCITRGNISLVGLDRNTWSNPNLDDLANLKPPSPEDGFTSELTLKLINCYNTVLGRHIHPEETASHLKNTIRYRDEGTFRVLKTLTTLVACLLPIGSIAVLYVIESMPGRLGAIAVFTTLFSFSLNLITAASTKEIFGATAAFAAVLVVFIGTNDSSRCPVPTTQNGE